ncbi:MAG: DNA repair protein RecN [Bacteroidetes bacterium]|jgi:DNA repair protein RecN (Recombination protein N)|nr:DNA repair protein RecN [Bacteroidota bacterium]MBK9352542.1 DNA repair protein RecN [Bacteroidota bacterium]MBL0286074.1 DNA repair protein RecN [Bacteroidota bacterium]
MLQRLSIKNYAIIESVDLDFDSGFNIITGETGAGKSILMGALGLILGKRADTSVLRNPEEKCYIEATFSVGSLKLVSFFEENDIDYQIETIIRREINAAGKSRAFINDQPVNLELLRDLTSKLVDIHAQQETGNLMDSDFLLAILDGMANNSKELELYKTKFQAWKKTNNEYAQLKKTDQDNQKEKDFLQFQFDELNALALNIETDKNLAQELELLENAELVKQNLLNSKQILDEGDLSILTKLRENNRLLNSISDFSPEIKEIKDRCETIVLEFREIVRIVEDIAENTEYSAELIQKTTERVDLLNRMCHKHQCSDFIELKTVFENLESRLLKIDSNQEALQTLENRLIEQKNSLQEIGNQISSKREKQIEKFESTVSSILKEIGMPFGFVELKLEKNIDILLKNGIDEIKLFFSPNKGIASKTLDQVGSGGEKSRLMLAIKSLVAEAGALPTLIFDEIDTGISGDVAQKVAIIFTQLAKKHQLISITHLPQIAAKADKHFFVFKDHNADITATKIKELDENGSIIELATMLSGANPSAAAIQNAKDLMGR